MQKTKAVHHGAIGDTHRRYLLWRSTDLPTGAGYGVMSFVMLNPSTADDTHDDATIRRCIGFARDHRFSGIVVANLYSWRATDPRELVAAGRDGVDVVGPANDAYLDIATGRDTRPQAGGDPWLDAARTERVRVVVAWGAHRSAWLRGEQVAGRVSEPWCFGTTRDGAPRHPLYLPKDAELRRWGAA